MSEPKPVLIVGAGLAGLCCARGLATAGVPVLLLEASEHIGGRVATVEQDGFLLDVGFQVLLTAYPEAMRQLDYTTLGLRSFRPGALVRSEGKTSRVVDPWRAPIAGMLSLLSPVVSMRDALRMGRLRKRLLRDSGRRPGSTQELLREAGISERLRRGFLDPFFAGVTLDPELDVPADYFAFLFRMFAQGDAALPARGMRALADQLAGSLPPGSIRTGARVREVEEGAVRLEDGGTIQGSTVVVATDGQSASELCPVPAPRGWNGTTTIYFDAERAPFRDPLLMLNGTGEGPVAHCCVPSNVQPGYAPGGRALVSVSVIGRSESDRGAEQDLVQAVRDQLGGWFGNDVEGWRWLRSFRIPRAQPRLPTDQLAMTREGVLPLGDGLIACGDYLSTPSIQGAMSAGRYAAELLLDSARATMAAS